MNPSSPQIPNVPGLPNVAQRPKPNTTAIIIGLAATACLFLALWVVALVQGASNANELRVAQQKGVEEGKAAQAKTDEDKLNALVNSPYKTYSAPAVYGGLEVKYPKTWNAQVTETASGASLNLILHPEILTAANATKAATRVVLTQTLMDTVLKSYQDKIKKGTVKSSSVTVAGIAATRLEGVFDDKEKQTGVVTLVAVRDKVIALYCDDKQYVSAYNDIVAQFKVNP